MKKNYLLSFLLLYCSVLMAQTKLDSMLVNVEQTSVTSGIIYERVTQFANLYNFNRPKYPNTADYKYLRQGLSELYRASNQTRLISLEELERRITGTTSANEVDIAIVTTPFEILNYNYKDERSGGLLLDQGTQRFSQISDKPPFYTLQTTIIAPTKTALSGSSAVFKFKNNLYLTNDGNDIKHLVVDFGSVRKTIVNNGVFLSQTITVPYTSSGTKEFTCTVTFANTDILTTKGNFYFDYKPTIKSFTSNEPCTVSDTRAVDDFIEAEEPFQGYAPDDPTIIPKVEYRTFYADASFHSDLSIYKPVIIIDGFDPGDRRKIQDCDCENDADCASENVTNGVFNPLKHRAMTDLMEYQNEIGGSSYILEDLREEGYDVLMVNHPTYETTNLDTGQQVTIDGGAYYIESNALALVALIKRIKQQLATVGSTEPISIVGPSMGGQISRYALAYMEKKYAETNDPEWQHNVGLWVSVDSPHLGANIPIGDQALLFMAGEMAGSEVAKDFYKNQLGSVAAKQQLIEFHKDPSKSGNYQINEDHLNGRVSSQGYGSDDGSSYYKTYYNKQESNGLPNSHGYPQNLRKIALVNGSVTGVKIGYPSQRVLNIRGFQNVDIDLPWPLGSINFDIHIASLESYFMPRPFNGNKKVARFKAGFDDDLSHYSTNINSRGNMDIVPGGWYPAQKEIADGVMGTTPIEGGTGSFWRYPGANLTYWFSNALGGNFFSLRTLKPEHSFISSFSAIAHTNPDQDWSKPLNYNLVCSGDTYFDSYFGHEQNTQHTSFNADSADWLFKELSGNPQDPFYPINESSLRGKSSLCYNEVTTYSFNNCKAPGDVVNWEVSNHLEVLSSTGSSLTVKSGEVSTSAWIKATFNNGIEIIKDIYIGPQRPIMYGDDGEQIATFSFCTSHNGTVNFRTPSSALGWEWNQVSGNFNMLATNNHAQFYSYQPTSGIVTVRAMDECGWSVPTFLIINFSDCSRDDRGYFKMAQNPITNGKLQVVERRNDNLGSTENRLNNQSVVTFELYDFTGLMLTSWRKERNTKNLNYNFDVSQYEDGHYFIKISCDDISEMYQIVINN